MDRLHSFRIFVEVAQVGRTLARSLGCNEDLTEAICLAHALDGGHDLPHRGALPRAEVEAALLEAPVGFVEH